MVVVKVVDQDVADKVDTKYIEEQFANLPNIGIVYMCTAEGGEDDDWIEDSGMHHFVIQLPYREVIRLPDIRPLMVEMAKERLGLTD